MNLFMLDVITQMLGIIKMEEIGISVIMPSYLGEYPGSRKDPDKKFIRSVKSFKEQSLKEKELIIISDGCEITNQIYHDNWKEDPTIRLIISEKMQVTWPGELREMGRSIAKYDWITYLDSDDMYLDLHLSKISTKLSNIDSEITVLFNIQKLIPLPENPNELMLAYCKMKSIEDYLTFREQLTEIHGHKMAMAINKTHSGTWQLVHHKQIPHRWMNSDEMGEDAFFIERIKRTEKWEDFKGAYIIGHTTFNRMDIWDI